VDCLGGDGDGPQYVSGPIDVIGVDIYELDRDGNGIACEAPDTPPPPPPPPCDPNYTGCVPIASDVDCADLDDVHGPIKVVGVDIYELDSDGNGIACDETDTLTCDPNYSGCVPIASDVDCAGGGGDGPKFVRGPINVIGRDIYKLDRDGDGIACEDDPKATRPLTTRESQPRSTQDSTTRSKATSTLESKPEPLGPTSTSAAVTTTQEVPAITTTEKPNSAD
jgi:hypothetical protein